MIVLYASIMFASLYGMEVAAVPIIVWLAHKH